MSSVATAPNQLTAGEGRRKFTNNLATVLVWASVVVALIPLVWVLWTVVSNGVSTVLHASWWSSTTRNITYTDPGGGALHAVVGHSRAGGVVHRDLGAGRRAGRHLPRRVRPGNVRAGDDVHGRHPHRIPSIVAALFIYALIVVTLDLRKSGWLVSMALMILMVPVIVRTTEEMLKLVPNELREASYALGVPKWKTILKVVVPTAFTGLITGVVLGIARVAGETAPLLILVSPSDSMNSDPFSGAQTALPTLIRSQFADAGLTATGGGYHLDPKTGLRVAGAVKNYAVDRMWGAALTLILIVLVLTVIARLIGRTNKLAK